MAGGAVVRCGHDRRSGSSAGPDVRARRGGAPPEHGVERRRGDPVGRRSVRPPPHAEGAGDLRPRGVQHPGRPRPGVPAGDPRRRGRRPRPGPLPQEGRARGRRRGRRLGRGRRCARHHGDADRAVSARRAGACRERRGRLGGGADRGRHPQVRPGVRARHHARRGRPHRAGRQLHEGLLSRPGADRPAALPRARQPRPARPGVPGRRARAGLGGHRRRAGGRPRHVGRRLARASAASASRSSAARSPTGRRSTPAASARSSPARLPFA